MLIYSGPDHDGETALLAPKERATDLGLIIFEGKITMSRRRTRKIRDLALHPDYAGKPSLQYMLYRPVESGDGIDLAQQAGLCRDAGLTDHTRGTYSLTAQ